MDCPSLYEDPVAGIGSKAGLRRQTGLQIVAQPTALRLQIGFESHIAAQTAVLRKEGVSTCSTK
jgi:hypothetical protein